MSQEELFNNLWKACNELRGKIDPSEYKYIILTIMFLKYASDTYELKTKELKMEKGEDYYDELDFQADQLLIVPEGYRWHDVIKHTSLGNIHTFIDECLRKIEESNKRLGNSLWKKFGEKFTKHNSKLVDIINIFTNCDFGNSINEERDFLGRAYEYFLKQFGEQSGKKAGEFYTPKSVVELMVDILNPADLKKASLIKIYDPTCGSGGMFVQSAKLVTKKLGEQKVKEILFLGQEINEHTYGLAKMNLAIRGLAFDLGEEAEDTLQNDLFKDEKVDFVIANPPFNLTIKKANMSQNDSRWKYGIPTEQKGNYYFVQHMISKLNSTGVMATLLDNGSQTSNASKLIRENILKDDLYEAVIELPNGIFFGTNIQATLYILNKDKKQKNKVLFINAKDEFVRNGILNELTNENINKIVSTLEQFRETGDIDIKNWAKSVSNDEIIKNNCDLSPKKFISEDIIDIDYEVEYKNSIKHLESLITEIRSEFDEVLKVIKDSNK